MLHASAVQAKVPDRLTPRRWLRLNAFDASGSAAPLLAVQGLHKSFASVEVLHGIDFRIAPGEKVCIIGPSGSGKTTLLRCLNLLVEPTRGEQYFKGELVGRWPGGARVALGAYRSRISMVFQHFELFPHLTALQNITLGPRHALHENRQAAEGRALELLERIGLARFAKAYPRTLSGGQKQRVAIARALAMRPDLILFDEPTSALDAEMVGEVLELMRDLASAGMTMVIVTHELAFARDVADRVVVMEHGAIVEEGPAEAMFGAARSPRTRDILRIGGQR
jgi:polar amino acid transport system ATP-binding protein